MIACFSSAVRGSRADRSLPRRSHRDKSVWCSDAPDRSRSRSTAPAHLALVRSTSRIRVPVNDASPSSAPASPVNDQSPSTTSVRLNVHRSNELPTSLHRVNTVSKNEQPEKWQLTNATSVSSAQLKRAIENVQSLNVDAEIRPSHRSMS